MKYTNQTQDFSKQYRKGNPRPLEVFVVKGVEITATDLGDAMTVYRRMKKAGRV